jgi:hypothetical protein
MVVVPPKTERVDVGLVSLRTKKERHADDVAALLEGT